MAPGTDFAQQTRGVNAIDDETITELTRIVCYDQPIYEDMRLEGDEWLGLTLGVDRASVLTTVQPMYNETAILIQDNDSKLLTLVLWHTLGIVLFIPMQMMLFLLCRGCGWSGADILPYFRRCGCGGAVCYCLVSCY